MLRREENDLITRTNNASPLNDLMRRNWLPTLLSTARYERNVGVQASKKVGAVRERCMGRESGQLSTLFFGSHGGGARNGRY